MRSFWELESLDIKGPERTLYDDLSDTVNFRDGRYEVFLPWKEFHQPLPDHYQLSLKRLHGLLHRLRQNPSILHEYDSIIQDQVRRGIVEVVDSPEISAEKIHTMQLCDKTKQQPKFE